MAERSHTEDLLDRVRLHRQGDEAVIVLVEGSPDRAVLRRVLSVQRQIFPGGTRHDVLVLVEQIISRGLGPVVAVVDRDFDDIVASAVTSGLPVVAFDGCDLESMLWETVALQETLESLGSERKMDAAGGVPGVKTMVDRLILPLQRLRAANQSESLGLDFSRVDLRSRIRGVDPSLSVSGLCDSLRQGRTDIDRQRLISLALSSDVPLCPITSRELYRGKDRLAGLGALLKRTIGNLRHQEVHYESIARLFYANARREAVQSCAWLRQLESML